MDTQILWFASRGTGAVSLVLFTAVMVLGIITSGRMGLPGLPRAGVLRLHRNLSLISVAFLAIHIVTAIADGYVDLSYWDVLIPFDAGFDPFWIGLATVARILAAQMPAKFGQPVKSFHSNFPGFLVKRHK